MRVHRRSIVYRALRVMASVMTTMTALFAGVFDRAADEHAVKGDVGRSDQQESVIGQDLSSVPK